VGDGPAVELCTGAALPAGYAAGGGDCAPDDPARWRSFAYAWRDADGDGFFAAQAGTLCVGAAPPAGYLASAPATPPDCDDANPAVHASVTAYADADGDGVGAGAPVAFCTDGAVPPGYSAQGTDCAPDDPSRWQTLAYAAVDRDGDGATAREVGTVCVGAALPAPYRATASGNDCDDADPTRWRWVVLYPDRDGDGIGAPPRDVQCLGSAIPTGWSIFGYDPDDTNPAALPDPAEQELVTELL
jgi:hypothetical protein